MSRRAASGLVLLLILVAAAGFWAGRVALAPPQNPLDGEQEPVTYEVVEQTIGDSLQFGAIAEWKASPLVRAGRAGVVTSIEFANGDSVAAGDVLFTLDLRPVVIAHGDVPAFRDLEVGVTGADVAQLEELLDDLGLLKGEADTTFDEATAEAITDWQSAMGVTADGVIRRGDVVFASELPVRIAATDNLAIGASLSGGEIVVNRLPASPTIVVPLTPEQRNLVPLSGAVELTYADGTWDAVIARALETTEQGLDRLDLILTAPDGGPACGDVCLEWIPPAGRTSFSAQIVVIPETTGPVLPLAAITTDPGGRHSAQLVDGSTVEIEVVVSTGGLAVVRGVAPGDVVILPFTDTPGG